MQNKLRQLILSALMRNPLTADLSVAVSLNNYAVTVSGIVPSFQHQAEVIRTIEAVSPYLQVTAKLKVAEYASATS